MSQDYKIDPLLNRIFLSPKLRNELKDHGLAFKRIARKYWHATDEELKQTLFETRETIVSLASLSARLLSLVQEAEEWNWKRRLRNKKFFLFQHQHSSQMLLQFTFTRSYTGSKEQETLIIPHGLSQQKTPQVVIRSKQDIPKTNYNLIHSGIFYQKFINLTTVCYSLKAKNFYLQILCSIDPQHPRSHYQLRII